MSLEFVSTYERPDLVPIVARWQWEEFWRPRGEALEDTLAAVRTTLTPADLPRTYILLEDGRPVGTASLAAEDLEERPDLTPWLAGVVVDPAARGRGLAARLVAGVEAEARARGVATLWLYTRSAERIYARAGWRKVEPVAHDGKVYALMRRDLEPSSAQRENALDPTRRAPANARADPFRGAP